MWREIEQPWVNEFDWIEREFDRLRRNWPQRWAATEQVARIQPALNVSMSDDQVVVVVELPGFAPEQIDIALEGRSLTLQGQREPHALESGQTYLKRERAFGAFNRTLTLPYQVEAAGIQAVFEHGILTISLPRAESEKPRKVTVQAAG